MNSIEIEENKYQQKNEINLNKNNLFPDKGAKIWYANQIALAIVRVVDRVVCEMQDRTTGKGVCLKTNIITRLILF